jgi:hypothetical protein
MAFVESETDQDGLRKLRFRFLLTQAGSILASLVAESLRHSAMSFSSILMEGADFLISKATAYGISAEKDDESKFLSLVKRVSGSKEKATKIIRTSAYLGHIAVAGVGATEALRLLNEDFEPPGRVNIGIMGVAAALNLYNYFDARRQKTSGEAVMPISGIKAMAQTNFAETAGIASGVAGTLLFDAQTTGNYTTMLSSIVVSAIMARQVIREHRNNPDFGAIKFKKLLS